MNAETIESISPLIEPSDDLPNASSTKPSQIDPPSLPCSNIRCLRNRVQCMASDDQWSVCQKSHSSQMSGFESVATIVGVILFHLILFALAILSLDSLLAHSVAQARVVLVNNHKSPLDTPPLHSKVTQQSYKQHFATNTLNSVNTKLNNPLPIALLASLIRAGKFSHRLVPPSGVHSTVSSLLLTFRISNLSLLCSLRHAHRCRDIFIRSLY